MKVGDLVRFAPNSERAWYVPNAKVGIVKELLAQEQLLVFWTKDLTTFEWQDELEVISEGRYKTVYSISEAK